MSVPQAALGHRHHVRSTSFDVSKVILSSRYRPVNPSRPHFSNVLAKPRWPNHRLPKLCQRCGGRPSLYTPPEASPGKVHHSIQAAWSLVPRVGRGLTRPCTPPSLGPLALG